MPILTFGRLGREDHKAILSRMGSLSFKNTKQTIVAEEMAQQVKQLAMEV